MKHQEDQALKQEMIKIRHNKNEKNRQVIRKSISPSSRFLDNYFNTNMHGSAWKPNGQISIKKKYNYTQSGLSHIYLKNNVLQKLDIEKKKETQSKQQIFIEYDYAHDDEIVITIEHCSNCEEHQAHTQHVNDIYRNFAKILQKCIMLRFSFIKVYLKPIDTEIISKNEINLANKNFIIDEMYKEVRIGAMEIQLAKKTDEKLEIITLHSKLQSGQWPSVNSVLNKILNYMPMLNLDIKLYDKQDGLSVDEEDFGKKFEDLLFTRFENIKINLYQLKNEKIYELSEIANQELEKIFNPKKRKDFLMQTRMMEKESYSKGFDSVNLYENDQKRSNFTSQAIPKESSIRPFTGISSFSSSNYKNSSRASSANTRVYSFRPVSSNVSNNILKITSQTGISIAEMYDDKEKIESLKGMLIKTQYSDKKGCNIFKDLPHDCYLIEIEDSKNFQGCAQVIKFNKIYKEFPSVYNTNSFTDKAKTFPMMKKFYGLNRQAYSYAEIYIYHNSCAEKNDINLNTISGSEVLLKRIVVNEKDGRRLLDDEENKISVKENKKIAGRHDIVIVPGNYLIEVSKKGYEKTRKEIELSAGLSSLTVELNKQRKIKISICVVDYFNKNPLENVKLQLKNSNSDVIEEGLTDEKGNFLHDILLIEDVLRLHAIKDGFYSAQRNFILESSTSHGIDLTAEENNLQKKNVFLYLVKENTFLESKQNLLLLYADKKEKLSDLKANFMLSSLIMNSVELSVDESNLINGAMSQSIKIKESFDLLNINQVNNQAEEYPEIIRLVFKNINSEKNSVNANSSSVKYEAFLYTQTGNCFHISFPALLNYEQIQYWDMGLLDIKSGLFYETGIARSNLIARETFLSELLIFIEILIENKLYSNLFELFQFSKGILSLNNRLLHEAAFIRAVKSIQTINENSEPSNLFKELSAEFLIFLCDMMKDENNMISFCNFKNKVSSNLQNFQMKLN